MQDDLGAVRGDDGPADRAGHPTLRLVVAHDPPPASAADRPELAFAEVRGVNVHARQLVDGRDRKAVDRLARYITRPPLTQQRLIRLPDGRVELTLKSIWKDGTRALVFEPEELIARLVASVPPPRWHLLRYFVVLSSHSRLRSQGARALRARRTRDQPGHRQRQARESSKLPVLGERHRVPPA